MRKLLIIFLAMSLFACSTEPETINFGKDLCEFCKMTVIDKKFGAKLVNKNGKTVKFDSAECMLRYMKSDKEFKAAKTLIINYSTPGEMIDAQKTFYLHGGKVNSPMGGQLAAFKTREDAEKNQKELGGDVLLWADIINLNF